eukprot:9076137-Pyramimonas_sp.AAC.1
MSQAKLTGLRRARHLGALSCEEVSGEIGPTTSGAAFWSPELRGWIKQIWPEYLERIISVPG